MAAAGTHYTLTDTLLRQLSKRITSGTKLGDLGTFVLKVRKHEIEGAEYNKPTIQEAALHILDKWRSAQTNRQEAFGNLHTALCNAEDFRTLAADLLDWAEEEQGPRITEATKDELQGEVKQALIDRFEDFLKNDWLDDEDAKTMPLQNHYTEPEWTRTIKKGMADETVTLHGGLYQILESARERIRVLVFGKPGSGKSSALAKLALDWAQDSSTSQPETGLNKFSFMFVVTLRDVDSNDSLEDVILEQHGLNAKRKRQVKAALETSKTLIAFDGYDEYTKGTNSDIDAAISGKRQMSYIVTSRPGDFVEKKNRKGMTETQITGLSSGNIAKCAEQYLDNDLIKTDRLRSESSKVGIYDLLATPIVLLLVCVLFEEKDGSLPKTKTEIVQEIINMLIERSIAKGKLGEKEPEEMQKILTILGQLSWQASQKDTKQLYVEKTLVEKENADILNLGLLHGSMEPEKSSRRKQPKWLTYPHKLIQDFLAGFYASKCSREEVQAMFPSWKGMGKQFEVVKFMCGLRDDPSDVIDHICQQFAEDAIDRMRTEHERCAVHVNPLVEIARETKGKSVNPLCNDHITCVQRLPLKRQSKLYVFDRKLKNISCENQENDSVTSASASPTCAVYVCMSHLPAHEILTAISRLNQTITDLRVVLLTLDKFSESVFKMDPEARCVILEHCTLPLNVLKDLGQQLSSCYKLQVFSLYFCPRFVGRDVSSELKVIDVDHSRSPSHVAAIRLLADAIASWGPNPPLRQLLLRSCDVDAKDYTRLMKALQTCRQLWKLKLSFNHLGSAGARLLAEVITSWGPNPALQELDLSDCEIHAKKCVPLMKALPLCINIAELDLSRNQIGSTGARLLAEAIKSWGPSSPLQMLNLEECKIDAAGCVPLMKVLPFCGQLRSLHLNENPIGGTFKALDPSLVYPQLRELYLRNTSLFEEDLQGIDAIIKNQGMPCFDTLWLGYKKLAETSRNMYNCTIQDVLHVMFQYESDEMLRVWKSIVQNVPDVELREYDIKLTDKSEIRKAVEAEETRRIVRLAQIGHALCQMAGSMKS